MTSPEEELSDLRARVARLEATLESKVLDLHRINIVEADGTLRATISNRADFPPARYRGQDQVGARIDHGLAGILFFNDDSTECGGLTCAGSGLAETGRQVMMLSMDKLEQNEVVSLQFHESEGNEWTAGLLVYDRPDQRLTPERTKHISKVYSDPDSPERSAEIAEIRRGDAERLFIGKRQGKPGLWLRDAAGQERLEISIGDDGDPEIAFFDQAGECVYRLTQDGPSGGNLTNRS